MTLPIRLALLAVLGTTGIIAQSLYIDLGGDWRIALSDRPEYARQDFDDRSWDLRRLPWTGSPLPLEHYWLRRTIEIPPGANPEVKALTVGLLNEAFEIYINGNLVARVGSQEDPWSIQTARPRTFLFHDTGTRVTVALRVWQGWWKHTWPGGVHASWAQRPDEGPYLLTSPESAPPDVSKQGWANRIYTAAPLLPEMAAAGLLALLLALLFLSARESRELLALAALVGSLAFLRCAIYGFLLFDVPMAISGLSQTISAGCSIALALFVNEVSAVRWPWLRYTAVLSATAAFLLRLADVLLVNTRLYDSAIFLFAMSDAALLLTAMSMAGLMLAGLWQSASSTGWRTSAVLLQAIGAVLVFVDSQRTRSLSVVSVYWGGWGMLGNSYDLAVIVMSVSAAVILVRRLGADRREKQRLASELEAARLVQRLLVAPRETGPQFKVDAAYQPALEVGGDFYQIFPLDDGGLLVLVGDVSGKGLKSAMVVSLIVGALGNRRSSQPAEVLSELNHALAGRLDGGFVTCCCMRFASTGEARAANAGHPLPYVDGLEWAMPCALPLGVADDAAYEDVAYDGRSFTLVSDGVVEATNAAGELFGFDRTRDISDKSASEIAGAARAWGQNDDITVVTVRRQR